jgi:RNA polymerase sigma factor (TIGR02999 family)
MDASIAALIASAEGGDRSASDALFSALYAELHRLARRELARNGSPATLGATSLLHQAYVDMAERGSTEFPDRHRFMAYAARVMRGLIIDYVRSGQAQKRGGLFELTSLPADAADAISADELSQVSAALDALAEIEPPLAEVVDLKFFCGFSFTDISAMQGVSERTVQRHWQKARVYLHQAIRGGSALS